MQRAGCHSARPECGGEGNRPHLGRVRNLLLDWSSNPYRFCSARAFVGALLAAPARLSESRSPDPHVAVIGGRLLVSGDARGLPACPDTEGQQAE